MGDKPNKDPDSGPLPDLNFFDSEKAVKANVENNVEFPSFFFDLKEEFSNKEFASFEDFATEVNRLREEGDNNQLSIMFLFLGVEERGDYLLWGCFDLKALVLKCGFSAQWFYSRYNAAPIALMVGERFGRLPLVCLQALAKVPTTVENYEEKLFEVLEAAKALNGGITESNILEVMKKLVPKVVKSGDSEKVGKMKSIIRSKDAIIKELGDIDPEDGVLKAKVATLEAATKDLLITIK